MNLFGISSIITVFASLGFGLFVYSHNRKSVLGRSWFLFSGLVALWGFALFKVISSTDVRTAVHWQYLLDIAGIFVPVFYFFFVSTFLGRKDYLFRIILTTLAAAFAFFSITPLFKTGVSIRLGFYWVETGPFYYIFPAFFIGVTLFSLALLFVALRRKIGDHIFHQQVKYQILAALIGFSGGITNFLPQFFNIFPFGNYFITLYIFFMSYSILRNRLFNVKTVATELFAGGTILLFLFTLLSSETLTDWVLRFFFFFLVCFFSVLLVRGVERTEQLADALEKSNTNLEKANERLKELDQLKSEFVSFATHQIRGPVTAIKGYASMLLEGDYGVVPQIVKGPVETIFQSSSSLAGIVQDFLDVSRIEQGRMKYDLSVFDVGKLVQDVAEELAPTIAKKGLELRREVETGILVHADLGKLRQVVENLIDNAQKYTAHGVVTVGVRRLGNGRVEIAVRDTGVGITQETTAKLFQKFSRAEDASKANILGTGLGLYVAKQLITAQGGTIRAESEGAGKGSSFIVELPIK